MKYLVLVVCSVLVGFLIGRFPVSLAPESVSETKMKELTAYREKQISAGAREKHDRLPLEEKILDYRKFTLPLNNPDVVLQRDSRHMSDKDLVTGVMVSGAARAYPWWILSNFHVVNDVLGGVPILVTLCEACGASTAFEAHIPGRMAPLDFSSANGGVNFGTFKISDSVTLSVWHPFVGIAYMGPLKGQRLKRLDSKVTTWAEWRRQHPDTDVVMGSFDLRKREHGLIGAVEIGDPGFSEVLASTANLKDQRLPRHEIILGIPAQVGAETIGLVSAAARAYPLSALDAIGGIVYDNLLGDEIAVFKTSRFAARAYKRSREGVKLEFSTVSKDPLVLQDQVGRKYDEWGFELDKMGTRSGSRLEPLGGYVTEWYEWVSAFPGSEIFKR